MLTKTPNLMWYFLPLFLDAQRHRFVTERSWGSKFRFQNTPCAPRARLHSHFGLGPIAKISFSLVSHVRKSCAPGISTPYPRDIVFADIFAHTVESEKLSRLINRARRRACSYQVVDLPPDLSDLECPNSVSCWCWEDPPSQPSNLTFAAFAVTTAKMNSGTPSNDLLYLIFERRPTFVRLITKWSCLN